ncbi:glutamate-1-semialdehyde 2,1-aminomutase [Fusarium oxysporum f. sp. conglutinans race 2 54008]|uniref:Glutamate-1-semialdehyde 2,1-aminomutase n=1 Tax=Fusarium oxysporum f. sp. conglutinans race 2 54008 TaxID=1089457 RepID=X0ISL6_FUSOX|nr:glutamate-1-semialdehyde 2,1-aminomutase [Fusarium oxysporum f. sp. conglutinans race 2 54008]
MATNIVVITDAGTLALEIKDEIGAYSDIVGSRSDVNAPIVAGIWDLFDRKTPTESCTAEWDEMKYVVKASHKRAQETLAGGNTRPVLHGDPFALYMEGGQGPYLYSVDKREYLDFVSDYSAAFYGHSNPAIAEAISSVLSTGFSLGSVTRKECHLGERIKRRFPSMERVRFCNSGTEANTYALVTATEFTGRKKVSAESAEGYP